MKYNLSEKLMTGPVDYRPKAFSYLINDSSGDTKTKGTKNCIIKRKPV